MARTPRLLATLALNECGNLQLVGVPLGGLAIPHKSTSLPEESKPASKVVRALPAKALKDSI